MAQTRDRQAYFLEYSRSGRHKELARTRRIKLRQAVIAGYGGKCVKCGFQDPRALHLDHVNGNGRKERKELAPTVLLGKILKLGCPSDYQILCANCNSIKMYENKEFPGWAVYAHESMKGEANGATVR